MLIIGVLIALYISYNRTKMNRRDMRELAQLYGSYWGEKGK
jgi:hypothetical protein